MSLSYHVNSDILTMTTMMMIMMKVTRIFDSGNEVKCIKTVKFSPTPVWCVVCVLCIDLAQPVCVCVCVGVADGADVEWFPD